jgi:hypothetical protein
MRNTSGFVLSLLLWAAPAAQAQFDYSTNGDTITLVQYVGSGGAVTISNFVTSIGEESFSSCTSLTSVTIPDSVASIGEEAFEYCYNLTNLTLGDGVTTIGGFAFWQCDSLTNVNIGNSVTSIGDRAFYDCTGLTNVAIGEGVTNIGGQAFANCTGLTAINVDPDNGLFLSVGGVLFNGDQTTLIQYPVGSSASSYNVPATVTNIAAQAFLSCASLVNVTMPNSVLSIGNLAFAGCSSLHGAYFLGNAPGNSDAFDGDLSAKAYYLPGTKGWGTTCGGIPTGVWPPMILNNSSFGVQSGGFSFTVSWATNAKVVVEASTNLAAGDWQPLQTNTIVVAIGGTSGSCNFSNADWTNYPWRFYRVFAQ